MIGVGDLCSVVSPFCDALMQFFSGFPEVHADGFGHGADRVFRGGETGIVVGFTRGWYRLLFPDGPYWVNANYQFDVIVRCVR